MRTEILRVLFLILCSFTYLSGQEKKISVSGTVYDEQTGEALIGAHLFFQQDNSSSTSNAYGFYSITTTPGSYLLITNHTGYRSDTLRLDLNDDRLKNIYLKKESTHTIQEVVVTAKGKEISKSLMGVQKVSINELNQIPVIFGERDILKGIQLLPGIASGGDGNSGFFVRGGGADQNLILLDEAPVYNASHLLGFFSTFNSDAIKDVTVYKGTMPAEYGGRLSSVLDVKMNDGNKQNYHVGGGIGLISSRLYAEGPIVKNKGSFIISARRTYADLFLRLSRDSVMRDNRLSFYDLNVKANYAFNNKNKVFISGYFGRDNLGFSNSFGLNWGNATATVRWNHIFNSRLFSNTSLIYSNYDYRVFTNNSEGGNFTMISRIRDFNFKEDLQYYIDNRNKLNFGINLIHHTITPGNISTSGESNFNSRTSQSRYSLENAAYISYEWQPIDKLKLNTGLRFSVFSVLGPGTFNTYDQEGNITGSSTYSSGQIVRNYFNLEPRLSAAYELNSNSTIKASYTRNVQNLHLLSNTTSGNPMDLWIGSTNNVRPGIADQTSLGYFQNFSKGKYEFSTEMYYKGLQNQIDYRDGADLLLNPNVESQLLYGRGRAYGLELFLKKKTGALTGWISYTLSRTERQFEEINNGHYFPARQDRTHDFAIVGIYQLNPRWTFSANWVYYTGNAVTWPSARYETSGVTTLYYEQRNGYRMPAYHRLDLSATLMAKKTKNFESSWVFSLYNAYGRENAFSIDFNDTPSNTSNVRATRTALFRFIPSVTYNFKF